MSGGSYNYAYQHFQNFAAELNVKSPERAAFKSLLIKVAAAARAIEWVDSCDYGPGDEVAPIMECVSPTDVLSEAMARATLARDELTALIMKVKKQRT